VGRITVILHGSGFVNLEGIKSICSVKSQVSKVEDQEDLSIQNFKLISKCECIVDKLLLGDISVG
jgi:hypothetical protein